MAGHDGLRFYLYMQETVKKTGARMYHAFLRASTLKKGLGRPKNRKANAVEPVGTRAVELVVVFLAKLNLRDFRVLGTIPPNLI